MLIGGRNIVNDKLVKEISRVIPISFIDYLDLPGSKSQKDSADPFFVMLNLMDIGLVEASIFKRVKEQYPDSKIIALHCFQVDTLIQKTLNRGYDYYISILNFSEEFQAFLSERPEIFKM